MINERIHEALLNAAITQSFVTYGKLANLVGLDMTKPNERAKLGELLGEISIYEHKNNRPLLSVVAWFSTSPEPSQGFYNLAESLDLFSKKQDKQEFFIRELNKAYQYWRNVNIQTSFNVDISVDDYKTALLAEGVIKERSLELLRALYDAPNCEATATDLANTLGYDNFPPVNALIGKLGKRIANHLNIKNPSGSGWWQVIANGEDRDVGFTWWLKDNLFDALVELNLLQEVEVTTYPDTLSPNEEYLEGSKKTITVNSYERNTVARNNCIAHYGAKCSVCNIDFSKTYGEIGKGFIHVHHLIELSSIGTEYKVHPIRDLRPVCPNCHAMLHQKKPAYTIEELIEIMYKNV